MIAVVESADKEVVPELGVPLPQPISELVNQLSGWASSSDTAGMSGEILTVPLPTECPMEEEGG